MPALDKYQAQAVPIMPPPIMAICSGAEGEVMGVIGISHDITERKQQEETLQRQAQKDSLLRSISQQFLNQDIDTAINR